VLFRSLARRFLAFFGRMARQPVAELAPAAERALAAHPWPGNVRELRNVIERATILSPSRVLDLESLPERLREQVSLVPVLGGDFTLEEIEQEHLLRVLARAPSLEEAAHVLGIDASTLWRKRKKLGR
jgi:NtrC-family two-component system response regulator AlgB